MTKLRGPWLPRLFVGLYLLIGVATLRHSAYGFASIESGNIWLGLLSALAVDVLMILFAHGLRDGFRKDYAAGLAIPALLSIYTQLLFAVSESQAMMVAPGAEWLGSSAETLQQIRVLALPAALPVLALVASLAGRGVSTHVSLKQHNRTVARLTDVKDELKAQGLELEKTRRQSEEQQGVVKDLQAETMRLKREIEAAAIWRNLPGKARARLVAGFVNGDKPRKNKEIALMAGVSESVVSRALAGRKQEK